MTTDPTNLYQQSDFPLVEKALIFHMGLGVFMAERSRNDLAEPETEEHVSTSWRRFRQVVGVKCRDALIALGKEHADAEWVGDVGSPPKAADYFKGGRTSLVSV